MKKNKGFTLVELLVSMTIMGILLVLAIPTVGNIIAGNKQKKFDAYERSLEHAAKLYMEEHEREEFSHYYGCIKVTLDQLKQDNLIKDFPDKDVTCSEAYVNVHKKINNTFSYDAVLKCADNRTNKEYKTSGSTTCVKPTDDATPPTISIISGSSQLNWSTRRNAVDIKIQLSDSGVGFVFDKKISYQWVKGAGNSPSSTGWKTLNFRNNQSAQTTTTTLDKNTYPGKNDEGEYFLWINESTVSDIIGNKTGSTGKKYGGPYRFDEKAPTCTVVPDRGADGKNGWYNSNVTLTLNPNRLQGSPIKQYGLYVKNSGDSKPSEAYNNDNSEPITTETNGKIGYSFVQDEAGNKCDDKSGVIKIDKTDPVVYVLSDTSSYNKAGFSRTSYIGPDNKGYGGKIRHVFCTDGNGSVTSGVQPNTFSVDLKRGGGYVAWSGCNKTECKEGDDCVRLCVYDSSTHIHHDYVTTGDKNTVYRCKDNANNFAKSKDQNGNQLTTSSLPHISTSVTSSTIGVRCACRQTSSSSGYYMLIHSYNEEGYSTYVCNESGRDWDPGCDCDKEHDNAVFKNKAGTLFMNCYDN